MSSSRPTVTPAVDAAVRKSDHSFSRDERGMVMSIELLKWLADEELPFTSADRALIDQLRKLEADGLIRAFIPPPHVDCDECMRQGPATVFVLTDRGRQMLLEPKDLGAPAQPPDSVPPQPPQPSVRPTWWHRLRTRADRSFAGRHIAAK